MFVKKLLKKTCLNGADTQKMCCFAPLFKYSSASNGESEWNGGCVDRRSFYLLQTDKVLTDKVL